MDLKRLRAGEMVIALAGIVLFASLFLEWYAVGPTKQTAWEAFDLLDIGLVITVVSAAATVFFQTTQRGVAIPIGATVITTYLAIIATACVVYRMIDLPGDGATTQLCLGAWIGLGASLAMMIGGYLSMRQEESGFLRSRSNATIPILPAPPVEP